MCLEILVAFDSAIFSTGFTFHSILRIGLVSEYVWKFGPFSPRYRALALTSIRNCRPLLRHSLLPTEFKCEPRSDRQKPGPDGNSGQEGSMAMSNTNRQIKARLGEKTSARAEWQGLSPGLGLGMSSPGVLPKQGQLLSLAWGLSGSSLVLQSANP